MGEKIKTLKKSLGLQTKPKKIHGPKFNPPKSQTKFLNHKNFQKALHETLVLNTPPLQKYLLKFSHPKKPFDHPCHMKSGEPPVPLGATVT